YLLEHPSKVGSYIPVPEGNVLTAESLHSAFVASFQELWNQHSTGRAILRLCTENEQEQAGALFDCFALGRADPRVLIELRYLLRLIVPELLPAAVHLLAHATPHPDILWTKESMIPEAICQKITAHFRWTTDEIVWLMEAFPQPTWQRGDVGESFY